MGVISYMVLCGQAPFDGNSDTERLSAVRKGVFAYPPQANLSKEAVSFINGAKCRPHGAKNEIRLLIVTLCVDHFGALKIPPRDLANVWPFSNNACKQHSYAHAFKPFSQNANPRKKKGSVWVLGRQRGIEIPQSSK